VQTYEKYKDQGVVFIGLTSEGEAALPQTNAYIEEFGISWPSGYGAMSTLTALGVQYFPTTFVVGADGLVTWHDDLKGDLDGAIRQALAASTHSST
jgi:hypothetical protein